MELNNQRGRSKLNLVCRPARLRRLPNPEKPLHAVIRHSHRKVFDHSAQHGEVEQGFMVEEPVAEREYFQDN